MIHTQTVWHSELTRTPRGGQLTCLGAKAEHRWLSDRFGAQRVGEQVTARPAEDEHVAPCVDPHARDLAQHLPGWHMGPAVHDPVW